MKEEKGMDFNIVISNVLKYGVILSTALIVIGTALLLVESPSGFPTTVQQLISSNYGKPTLNIALLFGSVSAGSPVFFIQLGLLVLLATPVARVAASTLLFAAEKDRLYVAITLFVLVVLLLSIFVIGPLVASSS
jgi:uncharacterized membrane protein